MSDKQTGGPAFPGFDYIAQDGRKNPEGMTLRDYFAAKAMQGLLASEVSAPQNRFAEGAYAMADAMLAAREK